MNIRAFLSIFAIVAALPRVSGGQTPTGAMLWAYDVGPGVTIKSSPAVSPEGTVYFAANGILYAITNGGSNKWTFTIGGAAFSSPAIATDGTIYVASDAQGKLYAVNPDGSQKWTYDAQGANGSPAIGSDNTVYIHGGGYLHAVSQAGTLKWTHIVEGGQAGTFNSPTVASDGTVYIGASDYYAMHALRPDGTQKWRFTLPVLPGDSPAVGPNGSIYLVSDGLYAFNPSGTNIWTQRSASFYRSGQAVGQDGTVYLAQSGAGTLYAFTPGGALKWRTDVTTNGFGPASITPAIDSAGMIYYAAFTRLFALSPEGQVQWTFNSGGMDNTLTSPVISFDGTIYVTFGSRLCAICGTNKLADSGWPMYRQNARHTGKIERPSLQQPKKRADANFQFQLHAQIDQTQAVETSSDLISWTTLTSVFVTNVPMDVVDLSASNFPSRYYRTVSP